MNNPYQYLEDFVGCELTYKEFCELNNEPQLKKMQKTRQLKEYGNYMDISCKNNKVKIIKIYNEDEIKPKIKSYHNDTINKFKISPEDKYKSGIYKIQLDNDVYIGQTNKFVRRYQQHKLGVKEGNQTESHKLIKNGATFEMIEIERDAKQRLIKEAKYVNKYINDGYNVLNSTKVLYKGKNKTVKQNRLAEPKMGIIFNKSDLDKITKLLSENNIDFKPHKFRDKKETANVQQ